MKTIHFKKGTLTLRWIDLCWRNDKDLQQCALYANTIIGFWRWKEPKVINWQLNFVVFGFGFQLTDEHREDISKRRKV